MLKTNQSRRMCTWKSRTCSTARQTLLFGKTHFCKVGVWNDSWLYENISSNSSQNSIYRTAYYQKHLERSFTLTSVKSHVHSLGGMWNPPCDHVMSYTGILDRDTTYKVQPTRCSALKGKPSPVAKEPPRNPSLDLDGMRQKKIWGGGEKMRFTALTFVGSPTCLNAKDSFANTCAAHTRR